MPDYRRFDDMGSGLLELDILTAECKHNGISIDTLVIAKVLQNWLNCDLAEHNIPRDTITAARLTIDLEIVD